MIDLNDLFLTEFRCLLTANQNFCFTSVKKSPRLDGLKSQQKEADGRSCNASGRQRVGARHWDDSSANIMVRNNNFNSNNKNNSEPWVLVASLHAKFFTAHFALSFNSRSSHAASWDQHSEKTWVLTSSDWLSHNQALKWQLSQHVWVFFSITWIWGNPQVNCPVRAHRCNFEVRVVHKIELTAKSNVYWNSSKSLKTFLGGEGQQFLLFWGSRTQSRRMMTSKEELI